MGLTTNYYTYRFLQRMNPKRGPTNTSQKAPHVPYLPLHLRAH